jgi:hypothetical protein
MIAAVLAVLATPVAAYAAQGDEILTGVVAATGAPFTITSCKILRNGNFWNGVTASIVNRTAHQMLTGDMTLRFFDTENTLIGQTRVEFQVSPPLASTDNAAYNANFGVSMTEPTAAVTKIECRPADATFTGNHKWAYGQTWPEKLLPIPKASADSTGGAGGSSATAAPVSVAPIATKPRLFLAVTNSWNDVFPNGLLVHDTLAITGGDVDAQLRPTDLTLTMTLPGGAKKTYPGLAAPAPQYTKIVPGVGTTLAYEVAPADDLGRLGMIVIPAHASVKTTVTFGVGDPISTPTDNRGVTVK